MGTTRSGWCLRPLTPGSKPEHDKCPKNFATGGTCSCDCAHPSERSRESLVAGADWPPGGGSSKPRAFDKTAQPVYAKRTPTEGGAEALRSLHIKGAQHVDSNDAEPEA